VRQQHDNGTLQSQKYNMMRRNIPDFKAGFE
jgi:hypothetical protein